MTGAHEAHIIVFVPPKAQVTLEGALDDAMAKGKGDVMTDATIPQWFWWILYIYGNTGWEVKGDIVETRRLFCQRTIGQQFIVSEGAHGGGVV